MIFAVDVDAVGLMLRSGRLTCPGCGAALQVWTRARTRRVDAGHGQRVELTPDRGLCRGCGATHVVVPAWYVPRRAYTVEVIGRVLLAGADAVPRAVIAGRVGVPVGTVAMWLRAARRAAGPLIRHAYRVGAQAVHAHRSAADWLGSELAEVLDALGDAARAFGDAAVPPAAGTGIRGRTGIDYLGLLAARHHRDLCQRLHMADPSAALPTAVPWHLVNLITARRGLLTAAPA